MGWGVDVGIGVDPSVGAGVAVGFGVGCGVDPSVGTGVDVGADVGFGVLVGSGDDDIGYVTIFVGQLAITAEFPLDTIKLVALSGTVTNTPFCNCVSVKLVAGFDVPYKTAMFATDIELW